ncbi:MAG: bifunctional (p)ppGpp synthetase/guanosine-3',5'-bis(diphosphate) 3'-pyrophosphohydrolase [Clostridia bacterium]|nr:bifunctional (p)ppGpp synthetase/guanosine-3',5'-bis(diphosphate) 3'-pyrophosphohydrolase [Clostridia bacterium]
MDNEHLVKNNIFAPGEETEQGCLEVLMEAISSYSQEDIESVKRAYEFARKAHSHQKRQSGQPYIVHPLSVAKILADLGLDSQSIAAALLHDVVEDTPCTLKDLEREFGEEIAELVDGVTKIGKVPIATKEDGIGTVRSSREEEQAENIRKMLLAMSKDIRVIIIKLADRLNNMRTLMFKSEQKRRDISVETIEIYAPIAHRLGIRPIKEELEDLAISYLDPVAYNDIKERLEAQSIARNEFLAEIQSRVVNRITPEVKGAKVSGRIKSVHGIYRKMYIQNKNFDEIYDIYAIRIIVDTIADCYNCLGIIHDMFQPIPGRFKDYISTPKPNMYQSLHTTVLGKEGIPFEVQIRTWEMHHTAEYGIAAHWKYKLGISGKVKFEERLSWIRQLLDDQKEAEDVEDLVSTIKNDLAPEEVYVFTPKGDVFNLPVGSTVIDFAYAVHSAVGNRMVGAKVDGRIVPIDYEIKTGEIIEIITSSQQGKGPSRDWLKIVKTNSARAKIRQWYKREKRDENIVEGKAELEKEFRHNYIRLTTEEYEQFVTKLAEQQHCKTVDDFYAAIGYGGVSVAKMMPHIRDEYAKIVKAKLPDKPVDIVPERKTAKSNDGVVVEGIDNCLIKFSRCCNPLPGDDIIGFITRGHGVSIHTRNCTNVPKVIADSAEPERWINAYWDDRNNKSEFKCTLQITCLNRMGMIADITGQLAAMRIMINDLNTRNFTDGRCLFSVTVIVNSLEHLKNLVDKLRKVDDVLEIERTGV